jgi:acyl-CoA synthetase (AMP-forming)/AMP-acid ligase II
MKDVPEVCQFCACLLPLGMPRHRCLECQNWVSCSACISSCRDKAHDRSHDDKSHDDKSRDDKSRDDRSRDDKPHEDIVVETEPEDAIYLAVQRAGQESLGTALNTAFKRWAPRPAFGVVRTLHDKVTYQTFEDVYKEVLYFAATLHGALFGALIGATSLNPGEGLEGPVSDHTTRSGVVALSFSGNSALLYKLEAACALAGLCSCCIPAHLDANTWMHCAAEACGSDGLLGAVVDEAALAGILHVSSTLGTQGSQGSDASAVSDASSWPVFKFLWTPDSPQLATRELAGHCEAYLDTLGEPKTGSFIKYSSGSTGRPKGIRVSKAWAYLKPVPSPAPAVSLSCYPPCWSTDTAIVWSTFLAGGRVAFGDPRCMDVLDMAACAQPSTLVFTPFLAAGLQGRYRSAAAHAGGEDTPAGRLAGALAAQATLGARCKSLTVGGASVPPKLLQFLQSVLHVRVIESYGTTETRGITFDGRVAHGVSLRIIPLVGDGSHGPQEDIGEVCVKSDTLVQPEDWIGAPPRDRYLPDGFFRTGDVGRIDPSTGRLQLFGRVATMVKLPTGVFFCPERLETLLAQELINLEAACATCSPEGVVTVHVTPCDPGDNDEVFWLQEVSRVARVAGLPVPARVVVRGQGTLVQQHGTWKPRRPETTLQVVGRVLGKPVTDADPTVQLRFQGVDSMKALQIVGALAAAKGYSSITFVDVLGSSLHELCALVDKTMDTVDCTDCKDCKDCTDCTDCTDSKSGVGRTGAGAGAGAAAVPVPVPGPVGVIFSEHDRHILSTWGRSAFFAASPFHLVFVTGGTGFIGQEVVRCLLKDAQVAQVWCLVRGTSKIPRAWHEHGKSGRLLWVVGDVSEPGLGLPSNLGAMPSSFTAVIHAAADVKSYALRSDGRGPDLLHGTNVQGTANVLLFAAQRRVARFVHVSTTSVCYPNSNAYAQTKAAAETVVEDSGGPTLSVRVPMIVGHNPEDWLHRMADACLEIGAKPACDCFWKEQVWGCTVEECAQDLVRLACSGWSLPYKYVDMASYPFQLRDLLREYASEAVTSLRPVCDIAWRHAAKAGIRFAPLVDNAIT